MASISGDGIEVHFDNERGYLELACEPGPFESYREVARKQLADFPHISIDEVVEIRVRDTAAAKRPMPRYVRVADWILGSFLFLFIVFAMIGFVSVIKRLAA